MPLSKNNNQCILQLNSGPKHSTAHGFLYQKNTKASFSSTVESNKTSLFIISSDSSDYKKWFNEHSFFLNLLKIKKF